MTKGFSICSGFQVDKWRAAHEGDKLHEAIPQSVVPAPQPFYRVSTKLNAAQQVDDLVDACRQEQWVLGCQGESAGVHLKAVY